MVIPKPAHLAMPTCEMPPTLHLYCKDTKKSVTSNKSSGFFHSQAVFLTLQVFYCHALVGFYVLNNLIVVVVRTALNQVKLQKRLATHTNQCLVNLIQQLKTVKATPCHADNAHEFVLSIAQKDLK